MTPASPPPDTLHAFWTRWFGAMESGDVDGLLSLLADPFLLKLPGQDPVTDRETLRKSLERFHAAFTEEVEWAIEESGTGEDGAWTQVRERAVITPREGGPPQEVRGLHLSVLIRDARGGWRLHRDVSSFGGEG